MKNWKYTCSKPCKYNTKHYILWKLHLLLKHRNQNICPAILSFEKGGFAICDKWEHHTGNHRGLFFEWQGEDFTASDEYKKIGDAIIGEYSIKDQLK